MTPKQTPHEKPRILVVDDDPNLLKGLSRILASDGYETLEAATGEECMEIIRGLRPDLVLLDVMLPDMNGLDLCKCIKSDVTLSDVYVVLISSLRTTSDEQSLGLESGADGYIARPIPNREIRARVAAYLRLKRMEQQLRLSEENFRITFDESPIGGAILGLDHRLQRANEELCRMTGYSPDELLISPLANLIHQGDRQTVLEQLKGLLIEDANRGTDCRYVRKNGEVGWMSLTVRLIRQPTGNSSYFLAMMEDITGRKSMEKERELLVEKLQQALGHVKKLTGLLPICGACKKIRNDKGYWLEIESYIREHSEAEFTHSICPNCAHKLYPELFDKKKL